MAKKEVKDTKRLVKLLNRSVKHCKSRVRKKNKKRFASKLDKIHRKSKYVYSIDRESLYPTHPIQIAVRINCNGKIYFEDQTPIDPTIKNNLLNVEKGM